MQLIDGLNDRAGHLSGQLWFHGEGERDLARLGAVVGLGILLAIGVGYAVPPAGMALQVAIGLYVLRAWLRPPSRHVVRAGCLYAGNERVEPGPVRATGAPGGAQHVYVGERLVFRARPLGEAAGVSVDGVTTFITSLADALDVALIDERDLPVLRLWQDSAAFRTAQVLQWARDDTAVRLPDLKRIEPVVPDGEHALSGGRFVVDGQSLHLDHREVEGLAVDAIDEVAVLDSQLGARLQLVVRCGAERLTLLDVQRTPSTMARLRYLEDAIEAMVKRESGSEDDLPDALRRLRGRANQTVG